MVDNLTYSFSRRQHIAAWLVHLFTASGAVIGLVTLSAIHRKEFVTAFWFMGAAIAIDSLDGYLARRSNVKKIAPQIDGALLDNILDYINYVVAPAFFLLEGDLLPHDWRLVGTSMIVLASAYQFTQHDAKTKDHFFKGFPSYWNIVVFYLFFWQTLPWINLVIVIMLSIMVFVPIKYVYPSRLDYLSRNIWLQWAMLVATLLWGAASLALLWLYPDTNNILVLLSVGYAVVYAMISLYRTFVPLEGVSLESEGNSKFYLPKKEPKNIKTDHRSR